MLTFGLTVSVLISFILYFLVSSRQRAVRLAKKVSSSLEESQEKFKILYENTSDAIMLVDIDTGKFVDGNPATLKLFNVPDGKKLKSLHFNDLSAVRQPDGQLSSAKYTQMVGQTIKEGGNLFEWVSSKYKGADFATSVLFTKIMLKGEDFILVTVRDISKQKEYEKQLQKRMDELRKMNELMVGREIRMAGLKRELASMKNKK